MAFLFLCFLCFSIVLYAFFYIVLKIEMKDKPYGINIIITTYLQLGQNLITTTIYYLLVTT
jgi:hypothetical protein